MGLYLKLRHLALVLIPAIFFACYPDTFIDKEFEDKGKVKYTFSGTNDTKSIAIIINGLEGSVYHGDEIPSSIIEGNNIVEATAHNFWGDDPTSAEDSFYSPTQEEAEEIIDGIFEERVGDYTSLEKKALICLGASDDFLVDYLVRKNDNTDAIVNYIGYGKNLEEELANSELLGLYGIQNLYIIRVPEDEIRLRLNDFIDKGFSQNEE
jgi:hypothetical protein